MKGRQPTSLDMQRMQKALAYVTAYDMGTAENEFLEFAALVKDEHDHMAMIHSLTQFSWLLLKSMEGAGIEKDEILAWYGRRFATDVDRLGDQ